MHLGHPSIFSIFKKIFFKDDDRTRPLYYPGADIFLISFSLVDSKSIQNVQEKWIPEIVLHFGNTNFIFVGNKRELKDEGLDESLKILRDSFPKTKYIEISCVEEKNLEEAVMMGIQETKYFLESHKNACILN
jgi:GTPase SAR1 family protein